MVASRLEAVYQSTGVSAYEGNPFIEALPPLQESIDSATALRSTIKVTSNDLQQSRVVRAHNICRIADEFFQPLGSHVTLSDRVSFMIRRGYVGRNVKNGDLQKHLQNGYERLQSGDLNAFRFDAVNSTAQSMLLIGCSGSGKTTSLNRILQTYPQVIYHPTHNIEQVVYLKIDCSHNGSLKEICLNFFRAMDKALGTQYEKTYGLKRRNGIETLMALMAQMANNHALGLLVIDEIQHLSRSRSGGSQAMLNFFVTMVNIIGVPIMLIGTPKAKEIFEADLRSARRGAGLGAIFWEPIAEKTDSGPSPDWIGFTNHLWKLQFLQKRDAVLTDTIRSTWYELSQGVMDVVIKLFVLAQLRALALNQERITEGLLRQVYEDDLKPVHPMLAALRSGIPERIANYSDLMVPAIEKRLIHLQQQIAHLGTPNELEDELSQLTSDDERRLYLMLKDVYESSMLIPIIQRIFRDNPTLGIKEVLPIVIQYASGDQLSTGVTRTRAPKGQKLTKVVSVKEWNNLEESDLRYLHSQSNSSKVMHQQLTSKGIILDLNKLIPSRS